MKLEITILGCGSSPGVPVIGCKCDVCQSSKPRNQRLRSSILISGLLNTSDNKVVTRNLVVDTTPDFRAQMLVAGVCELTDVLYTHTHADHCHGFDDLRSFGFSQSHRINCYLKKQDHKDLTTRFCYAFSNKKTKGIVPQTNLIIIEQKPFCLLSSVWQNLEIDPLFLDHYNLKSTGYRVGSLAYATDFTKFTSDQINYWKNKIHTMIVSGLHYQPHHSHSSIPETLELIEALGVRRAIITHLSHLVDYYKPKIKLPKHVVLAYDGLKIDHYI